MAHIPLGRWAFIANAGQHTPRPAAMSRPPIAHQVVRPASELTPHYLIGGHALHTSPYPPDLSWHDSYGASATDSLTLYLLALIAGPGPSGSTEPSPLCRGCSCPPRWSPAPAAPILNHAAATAP